MADATHQEAPKVPNPGRRSFMKKAVIGTVGIGVATTGIFEFTEFVSQQFGKKDQLPHTNLFKGIDAIFSEKPAPEIDFLKEAEDLFDPLYEEKLSPDISDVAINIRWESINTNERVYIQKRQSAIWAESSTNPNVFLPLTEKELKMKVKEVDNRSQNGGQRASLDNLFFEIDFASQATGTADELLISFSTTSQNEQPLKITHSLGYEINFSADVYNDVINGRLATTRKTFTDIFRVGDDIEAHRQIVQLYDADGNLLKTNPRGIELYDVKSIASFGDAKPEDIYIRVANLYSQRAKLPVYKLKRPPETYEEA